jgi:hypothetical protein
MADADHERFSVREGSLGRHGRVNELLAEIESL